MTFFFCDERLWVATCQSEWMVSGMAGWQGPGEISVMIPYCSLALEMYMSHEENFETITSTRLYKNGEADILPKILDIQLCEN